ncbi:hypothetical protein [Labrys monachus]|uniref:Uncharacterized protein n=1 Tax=Labrys monachus TaxID=217067 RepID=A0ABU0FAU0_9HYPH|nr:hypothetical protein [Labrys monachus]MDQ0391734.1 hypothetical protein [Labrys monachus]
MSTGDFSVILSRKSGFGAGVRAEMEFSIDDKLVEKVFGIGDGLKSQEQTHVLQ